MSVKDQLNEYIKDAKNEDERTALAKEFFISNAKRFEKQLKELSDDELDAVAGGTGTPYIGNIYNCDDFLNECITRFKNDICSAFIC